MAETKPKPASSLRNPKPKKMLGLSVPTALRLPHDDLIKPESSMPSQSSHTSQSRQSIAPERDFVRVPNSIAREVIPAGEFKGKSKQLYDCLYSMTRGAISPKRSVRVSRPQLMKKAGIGARVTFETNISHLITVGLLQVKQIAGEHEGNEYTVFLPEERTMPSQSSQARHAQNLDRLVRLESSQSRHSAIVDSVTTSNDSKTSFKTNTDDDEAFAKFNKIFRDFAQKMTGKEPATEESDRWAELAEVIVAELEKAAARAGIISSAPAFSAEHLRRRFTQTELKGRGSATREKSSAGTSPSQDAATVPSKPLTADERADLVQMVTELITNGGYTIEQAETQFGAGLDSEAWQTIRTNVKNREVNAVAER